MKSEKEFKNKINSLKAMKENVEKDQGNEIADGLLRDIDNQIDALLWAIEEKGGLPLLDEEEMYGCYH